VILATDGDWNVGITNRNELVDLIKRKAKSGVFLTTLVAFFFVEIGDKTQIATSLLAGQFHNIVLVTIGTTLGMMVANVPAVYFGEAITRVVPLPRVRLIAATLFALLGFWIAGSAILRGSSRAKLRIMQLTFNNVLNHSIFSEPPNET